MIYLAIAILLTLLELAYLRLASKIHIVEMPNSRSSHTSATISGGGIAFLFGGWLYAAFFGLHYGWFLAGMTLLGVVSFADDIRAQSVIFRITVQLAALLMMSAQLGIMAPENLWFIPIVLTICMGITNAYNFMDGINGITCGYSLAILAPMIYLNHRLGFIDMPFLFVTATSVLVFCFFNFRKKARCFAGDVGSLTIAYILIFALGRLIIHTGDYAYLVFICVYGVDSFLTICHRIMLHENLSVAHRKHAYQLMANELKIPHLRIALLYSLLQLGISTGMLLCPVNHYLYLGIVTAVLACAYIVFIKKNYRLHRTYLESIQK